MEIFNAGHVFNPSIPRRNGNGKGYPEPTSRRAFIKSAPGRIGALEDQAEEHALRLDAIALQLPDPIADEACVVEINERTRATVIEVRLDNLIEMVGRLTERVKRVEKRSLRSRRKLAALIARGEASLG
jgi:hypothetical protein